MVEAVDERPAPKKPFKGGVETQIPARGSESYFDILQKAGLPGFPVPVTRQLTGTTASTDVQLVAAQTGRRIVVTMIDVTMDNANTVDVAVVAGFGASATPTVPADGVSEDDILLSHPGVAPGSGMVRGDGRGIIGVSSPNHGLFVDHEVPTSGSLRVTVTFYVVEA